MKRREKVHPGRAFETPDALYADPRRSRIHSFPFLVDRCGAPVKSPLRTIAAVLYSIARKMQPLQLQSIPRLFRNNDAYIRRGWAGCFSSVTLKNARAI